MLEGAGPTAVACGELGAGQAAGGAGVVQGLGEVLAVEVRHELHDYGRARRVEGQQVGLVRAGALRDREDLFAEQAVDVRVDHLVGRGLETWLPTVRAVRGRHEEWPLGIDLEQWHLVISPGPAASVRLSLKAAGKSPETRG